MWGLEDEDWNERYGDGGGGDGGGVDMSSFMNKLIQ